MDLEPSVPKLVAFLGKIGIGFGRGEAAAITTEASSTPAPGTTGTSGRSVSGRRMTA